MGVVLKLQLAIHDYIQGMPAVMGNIMYMQIPDYIDALVTDEEVATEAKAFFAQTQK